MLSALFSGCICLFMPSHSHSFSFALSFILCLSFFFTLEKGIYFTFVFFICRYEQIFSEHRDTNKDKDTESKGFVCERFSVVLFVRILSFCRISHSSNQLKSRQSYNHIKYIHWLSAFMHWI